MLDWTLESVRQFDAIEDRRNGCSRRVNLGYGYVEAGMYEAAEQVLRETLVIAERMGLESVVAAPKQNLGLALAHLGRSEEARSLQEDAIEAFHAQKRPRMEDGSRIYLAHTLARAGGTTRPLTQARADHVAHRHPADVPRVRARRPRAHRALATTTRPRRSTPRAKRYELLVSARGDRRGRVAGPPRVGRGALRQRSGDRPARVAPSPTPRTASRRAPSA